MGQRFKTPILIPFLVILSLTCCITTGHEINFVHVVEEGHQLAKIGVKDAVNNFWTDGETRLRFKEVEVNEKAVESEKELCDRIFGRTENDEPFEPTIMFDSLAASKLTGNDLSSMVKSISREMGIPTVATSYGFGTGRGITEWKRLTKAEKEYLIHVLPPGDVIPLTVRDIAIHFNMSTAAILYDDTFEMEQWYLSLMQGTGTRSILRHLNSSATQEEIIKELHQIGSGRHLNYFVLGSSETLNKVLEAAEVNSMFGSEFAWYLITKGQGKVKCETCRDESVFFIKAQKSRTSYYDLHKNQTLHRHPAITADNKLDAYFYHDLTHLILEMVDDKLRRGKWPQKLTYPKCGQALTKDMIKKREDLNLGSELASEAFYGMFGKFNFDAFNDYDPDPAVNGEEGGGGLNYQEVQMRIWKMKAASNVTKRVADWEFSPLLRGSSAIMFTEAQEGSGLLVYKIVTIIQAPFMMKKEINGTTQFYGYCMDLLEEIRQNVEADQNFTYILYEVKDGFFGVKDNKTKQWNGMIGDLARKEADIALGPISVMAERETVVDFTVPYYDLVGITILMKKPEVPSHLFKFLTVLETEVWLCILAAYFFTSLLMYTFDRLSPFSYHNNKERYKDDDERREFTLKECLWFCMTSLTPQGGGEAPRNLSGRLVAATWWVFGFIIIASYTANLAAFLTVSRLDSPIESLDDLAKQYKIKYAPQEGTSSATYFERMAYIEERFYEIWKDMSLNDTLDEAERAKLAVWDYPVSDKYTKIWAQIQEASMPKSFPEGLERVKKSPNNDGFAFIAEATMVKYAAMTNCDVHSVGNEFSRKPLALAVQQESALKDVLSSAILKLLNQRQLESLKEKWWNKNPEKKNCEDQRKQSDGISINNIGGVFIVIFVGVVLACITLAIEYWYFRNKKDNTKVVAIKEYGNIIKNPHALGMSPRMGGPMGGTMGPMGAAMGPRAIPR